MKFKTKAQNLVALSKTNIKIPKILKFNVKDYEVNKFNYFKTKKTWLEIDSPIDLRVAEKLLQKYR